MDPTALCWLQVRLGSGYSAGQGDEGKSGTRQGTECGSGKHRWNSVTLRKKRKFLLRVEELGCHSPGRRKEVFLHYTELLWVPETEQGEDTVPMRWDSLGCIQGPFGLKNVSVHGADLNVVLKPQGGQWVALQESGVGISVQDETWRLYCRG